MEKVGRNQNCPCGSGKKFKHCCAGRRSKAKVFQESFAKGFFILLGPVVAIIVLVAILRMYGGREEGVGPGSRVWSAAHGHWHVVNADGGETEARPGQVWSPEHGHWHDAEPLSGARPKHFTSTVQGDLEQAEAGIEP